MIPDPGGFLKWRKVNIGKFFHNEIVNLSYVRIAKEQFWDDPIYAHFHDVYSVLAESVLQPLFSSNDLNFDLIFLMFFINKAFKISYKLFFIFGCFRNERDTHIFSDKFGKITKISFIRKTMNLASIAYLNIFPKSVASFRLFIWLTKEEHFW